LIERLDKIDKSVSSVDKKVDELVIISEPGISEELVITTGFQFLGSGVEHSITICQRRSTFLQFGVLEFSNLVI